MPRFLQQWQGTTLWGSCLRKKLQKWFSRNVLIRRVLRKCRSKSLSFKLENSVLDLWRMCFFSYNLPVKICQTMIRIIGFNLQRRIRSERRLNTQFIKGCYNKILKSRCFITSKNSQCRCYNAPSFRTAFHKTRDFCCTSWAIRHQKFYLV